MQTNTSMKTNRGMKTNEIATLLLTLALFTLNTAGAESVAPMPRTLSNARFVYVTAYDGDQFNPELLPEDRAAIGLVEDAISKWGKLTLVYRPQDADIILAVESRRSEDVLAVYDAHGGDKRSRPSEAYLWRVMGRGGLQKGESPLVSQFEKAWDKVTQ
jgi:hypothetical protein